MTHTSSSAPAMLELRHVGMRFADGTQALRAVDLSVPSGQFCVLLGASGAGKSTLLRIINGLERPTSGAVAIDGSEYRAGERRRGKCAVTTIHQGVDLVPRASVLDNVLCGSLGQMSTLRAMLGLFGSARKRHACQLLHRVGLSETQLYRRASELSGGQQQRVGVARAFISAPRLVLADEPVASLDPRTSREILTLLQAAAREHDAAVLCSLHQVDLATEFADRIVGMRGGRVTFDCAPGELRPAMLTELYATDSPQTLAALEQ